MIDLAFDSALEGLLNQFSVPMFALDRLGEHSPFHYVSVNRAFEQAGDQPAEQVLGRGVHDLLPKAEADIAHTHHCACAERRGDLRYRDQFTTAGKAVLWDTTLQHVVLRDGGDRIVGTSIRIPQNSAGTPNDPALDDIQYFSSMADLQLRNLISTFEIFRDRELFSIQNEQHIDKLTGMCRTVQRAVEDIRKVVHSAHDDLTPAARSDDMVNKGNAAGRRSLVGSDTVEALFADVTDDLQRFS